MNLKEQCSLYKTYLHKEHGWCFSTKPETVNIEDVLKKPLQHELLSEIRNEPDKDKRGRLKKRLWGITASSIQEGGRGGEYVKSHSGLIAFDIDKYKGEYLNEESLLSHLAVIKNIPYTVYCGRSASGNGLWGLFRISDVNKHSQHFNAMKASFEFIGITIDTAPSSIASLRFLSYDSEAFFNPDPKLFDLPYDPIKPVKKSLKTEKASSETSDGQTLIKRFNNECSAEQIHDILTSFGFNYHSKKGSHYYFTRPGKDVKAGLSVDYHQDKRTLYCFSSEVEMLDKWKKESLGWSCSALTALLHYGFNGNWANTFNYIKTNL